MKKALKILKEVGIGVGLFAGVSLGLVVFLRAKVPIDVAIPEANNCNTIDKNDYLVANDGIENAQGATVIYESTTGDLDIYGSELRYISGTTEPFSTSQPGTSDIPTDVIRNQ